MERCAAKTKAGVPCQLNAAKGQKYCHVHASRIRKRILFLMSSVSALAFAILTVFANLAQVGQWAGVGPSEIGKDLLRLRTNIADTHQNGDSFKLWCICSANQTYCFRDENTCQEIRADKKCTLTYADKYAFAVSDSSQWLVRDTGWINTKRCVIASTNPRS